VAGAGLGSGRGGEAVAGAADCLQASGAVAEFAALITTSTTIATHRRRTAVTGSAGAHLPGGPAVRFGGTATASMSRQATQAERMQPRRIRL
jgi:hypothetical protein